MYSDTEKITLLQRYMLYCDKTITDQLKLKRASQCSNMEDLISLIKLEAKREAYTEIQANIEKILYMR